MKRFLLSAFLALWALLPLSAMSYEQASQHAYYLSDKMAYELNLTDEQFELVYQINLDYLLSVDDGVDPYGTYWNYRNADLACVLSASQLLLFQATSYFLRPLRWVNSSWYFPLWKIYAPQRFFFHRPRVFATYRGASWRGTRRPEHASPYRGVSLRGGSQGMRDRAVSGRLTVNNNRRSNGNRQSGVRSDNRTGGQWQYPNAGSSSTRSSDKKQNTSGGKVSPRGGNSDRNRNGNSPRSNSRSSDNRSGKR